MSFKAASIWIVILSLGAVFVSDHSKAADPWTLYDANPNHVWNRLYRTLYRRESRDGHEYGYDEIDPLLWSQTKYLLSDPTNRQALTVLDEFLSTHGDQAINDPLKRAMLQRDLWAVFDWTTACLECTKQSAAKSNLQTKLVQVIKRLALSPEQIAALPDTYKQAVEAGVFAKAYDANKREQSYLPPDLFDPKGPWVALSIRGGDLVAPGHAAAFSGRSVFLVFMRLPAGREATIEYLKTVAAFRNPWLLDPETRRPMPNPELPQFPAGTQLALVRRMVLIDANGELRPTNVVEDVQIRVHRTIPSFIPRGFDVDKNEARTALDAYEFKLSRSKLFAREDGGLRSLTKTDTEFPVFRSHGIDLFEENLGQLNRMLNVSLEKCTSCHFRPGVHSILSRGRVDGIATPENSELLPSWDANYEANGTKWWKAKQYSWGLLQGLWNLPSAAIPAPRSLAQNSCLSTADVTRITAQVKESGNEPFNIALRRELLNLQAKGEERLADAIAERRENDVRKFQEENTAHLCRILAKSGWPSAALVAGDGQAAAFFLLKNSSSVELQKELLPVVVSLTKRGEIDRASLAGYVDRLRLGLGLDQLFGTEITVKDGFIVLYPIEGEGGVDARRSQYNLPPLRQYLRSLEITYQLPLIRAPRRPALKRELPKSSELGLLDVIEDADDVIRVETNLVSLEVSVYSEKLKTHVTNLEQKDFKILEDGNEETISYFEATDAPFDLILLLDLSGSTEKKRDLIRTTTRHFIETVRPSDRIAIVTFSDTTNVVAPLSNDRSMLLRSIANIEGTGGSKVWDALKSTLDQVVGPRNLGRRSAVVFMTDGAENHLVAFNGGSQTSFADLLETVRLKGTLIIPIYLDTEGKDALSRRIYEDARKTLAMLAEESGGRYYKARNIEDLNGVYDQVVADLAKIYSLGYRPANSKRDGSWRIIQVQLLNRSDLTPHTRLGYYAK